MDLFIGAVDGAARDLDELKAQDGLVDRRDDLAVSERDLQILFQLAVGTLLRWREVDVARLDDALRQIHALFTGIADGGRQRLAHDRRGIGARHPLERRDLHHRPPAERFVRLGGEVADDPRQRVGVGRRIGGRRAGRQPYVWLLPDRRAQNARAQRRVIFVGARLVDDDERDVGAVAQLLRQRSQLELHMRLPRADTEAVVIEDVEVGFAAKLRQALLARAVQNARLPFSNESAENLVVPHSFKCG